MKGNCAGLGGREHAFQPYFSPLVGCRPWEGPFSATTHPAGDRIRSHTRVSCITLRSFTAETSVQPASPTASPRGQNSPAFPCPAAQQPVPILLMSSHVAPDMGSPRPQLTARGEQLHPAGSCPHLAPGAHGDTQQPQGHGDTSSEGLEWDCTRGPLPEVPQGLHSLSHAKGDQTYTCTQSLDTSPSLNSSQRVPLSKAGPPHSSQASSLRRAFPLWLLQSLPLQDVFPQLTDMNRLSHLKSKPSSGLDPLLSPSFPPPWSASHQHPQLCTP